MARIHNPWRAMALVGVLALAGCASAADMSPSLVNGMSVGSGNSVHLEQLDEKPESPGVSSGLKSLAMVQGPVGDDGLLGAGCVVDSDEQLPDGDWFGFVLDADKHQLVVDVACVYGPGTDQFEVYADGEDLSVSSYVVVNDVVEELELRFGSEAKAYMAVDDWQPRTIREVVEEYRENQQSSPRGVWIRVEDGRISAVVQPYTMGVAAG